MSTQAKVTLFLQRKNLESKHDDVIEIHDDDEYVEMYRIVYRTPECKKKESVFYMTRSKTLAYIADLLKALTYDSDPFAFVQVTTRTYPSIQYQVPDLWDSNIRHLIEDMVDTSLRNAEWVRRQ